MEKKMQEITDFLEWKARDHIDRSTRRPMLRQFRLFLERFRGRRGSNRTCRWHYREAFRRRLRRLSQRAWTRRALWGDERPRTTTFLSERNGAQWSERLSLPPFFSFRFAVFGESTGGNWGEWVLNPNVYRRLVAWISLFQWGFRLAFYYVTVITF